MTSRKQYGRASWITASLVLGLLAFPVASAMAHGGGGGGGGHGGGMGGGHMGGMGMGGGHMGGMGMGYGHMGGMGMGYGHMGGMGYGQHPGYYNHQGYGGYNYGGRGYGGFGGIGLFPGFYGYGLGFGGLGYGLGYGGLGYGGLGYGYGGGYGYPYYYGGYPSGYGYSSGYGYGYPYDSNVYAAPGAGTTYSSAYVAPAASAAATMPAQGHYLGIDEEPVVDASGRRGMKVTNVYPGTAAQRAGLQSGDVIYSINGYLTEQRGNLAWIIANAAPANQLNMNVKRAADGQEKAVTATIQ